MKKRLACLLALALVLGCLLAGCGGRSTYASDSPANNMPDKDLMYGGMEFVTGDSADYEFDGGFDLPAEAPEGGSSAGTVAPTSEKLIYRADLTVETVSFDRAVSSLEALAGELGGFVESSNVSGYTDRWADGTSRVVDRTATYILRVPSDRFREAVDRAGTLGSVVNSSTGVENITSQFIDQEARKHALEVQEERLLAMLEQAEDVYVLVELESRLSEVRYEIESIERTLRNWQQQVDYSTVSIYLREVAAYSPVVPAQRSFAEKFSDALSDGWSRFVEGVELLVLGLAEALPVLVLLILAGLVALVIVLVCVRSSRRRRRTAPAPQPVAAPAPQAGPQDPPAESGEG